MSSDGSLTLGQDRGEHWPSSAQNSQQAPSELCLLPQTAFLGALPPKISTVPGSLFSMKLTHFLFSGISEARAPKNVYTCPEAKSLGGRKVLLWHPLCKWVTTAWPMGAGPTCSRQPLMGARAAWLVRVLLYVYTHMGYVCVGDGK